MNIETAKIKIIQLVAELQSETILKQLLAFLTRFQQKSVGELNKQPKQEAALLIARMPTPASISLAVLKSEQGYNMKKLNQAYARLDRSIWEGEDFDQLLKAI